MTLFEQLYQFICENYDVPGKIWRWSTFPSLHGAMLLGIASASRDIAFLRKVGSIKSLDELNQIMKSNQEAIALKESAVRAKEPAKLSPLELRARRVELVCELIETGELKRAIEISKEAMQKTSTSSMTIEHDQSLVELVSLFLKASVFDGSSDLILTPIRQVMSSLSENCLELSIEDFASGLEALASGHCRIAFIKFYNLKYSAISKHVGSWLAEQDFAVLILFSAFCGASRRELHRLLREPWIVDASESHPIAHCLFGFLEQLAAFRVSDCVSDMAVSWSLIMADPLLGRFHDHTRKINLHLFEMFIAGRSGISFDELGSLFPGFSSDAVGFFKQGREIGYFENHRLCMKNRVILAKADTEKEDARLAIKEAQEAATWHFYSALFQKAPTS